MASIRRPPITVLMHYKLHSPALIGAEKRTTNVKFKPFTTTEKENWLNADSSHGFIRIYEATVKEGLQQAFNQEPNSKVPAPNGTRSIVVPCTLDTSCGQICQKMGVFENELHVTFNGDTVRRLDPMETPLRVQNHYLTTIGITDARRQREVGDCLDLCYLIKFSAGRPVINDEFGRSSLSCYCHVRKGRVFHQWTKRLCVLNGARLLVYPNHDRCGTPDVIALSRAKVEDIHLRSRGRCIKITVATPRRPVQTFHIAFDSAVDLNTWLSRCLKGSAKVPPISDLSNLQLEYLPEQVFCVGSERLLTQLNLRRNCLKRRPPNEDSFTIGWLDDLPRLESLRSLNVADNDLRSCPPALFQLHALTELVLSGNKLSELSPGIGKLRNLQSLNVQNNWLSRLPLDLAECQSLTNLDLSFNRFASIPNILCELPSLDHWILNGNDVEWFVDESLVKATPCIRKIELRRCRLVQNAISAIPVGLLPLLTHLDIRDNSCVTSLDLKSLPSLQVLCCQRCSLYDVQLNGTALVSLFAAKNNLRNVVVMPVPKQLRIFDVAFNDLSQLPEWLTELGKIEKIIASHNRLVSLPNRMFTSASSLKTLILHHNNIASLPSQVENCFIECLDLHHNRLTQLPPEFLASAHKLRILNLSENQLVDLPPLNPFLDLNKVQQLYLACNRLTDAVVSVISAYRRLRILDLAYNNIKNMDDSCIEKLQLLESLNVSGNRLTSLPPSLACVPNLSVLRAHSNRLTSLPDFSKAPCLKVLDCGSNQLEAVAVQQLLSPQLKHLDVSCNPGLRLDTSAFQQFRSERLVSLIDMKRESRSQSALLSRGPSSACQDSPTKSLWQAGFSETSGERNKLCVSQIRRLVFRTEKAGEIDSKTGALFAIIDGGLNNEIPQNLATRLPDILRSERANDATAHEYMKYTLLSAHQGLQTRGQKMGASCTLCYIEEASGSKVESGQESPSYTLHAANVGHTEAVLCRKGKAISLTRSFLIEDASVEEMERVRKAGAIVTEENEVNGITLCSRLLGCNFLYPAVIPRPHVMSLDLQANDEFMLIASRGLWEVMDQAEAIKRIRKITNPILAAKHLQDVAQSYGFKENLSILVVRFFFTASLCESDSSASRPSPVAPMTTLRRHHGFVPAMSAVHVADSDDCSITSDEDVKSEPHDAKQIREPPNYYFEYKKQLKQLMLETGSSDAFSMDGPESLYSVATLIRGNLEPVGAEQNGGNIRSYFDDGYQSSEIAGPKPTLPILDFPMAGLGGNSEYASVVPSSNRAALAHPKIPTENGDGKKEVSNGQEDPNIFSPRSASSSCSSGLGKSSTSSPDNPPAGCNYPTDETPSMPQWRVDDEEALQDAKQRFQQARQLILAKLGNKDRSDGEDQFRRQGSYVARISVPDPIVKRESQRNSRAVCCHSGNEAAVSSDQDFPDFVYKSHKEKPQTVYQQISNDDGEIFNGILNQESSWHNYLSLAHSDDQIQCCASWTAPYECCNKGQPTPSASLGAAEAMEPEMPTNSSSESKHQVLLVANMDIDGSGPQNVVICDPGLRSIN